MGFIKHAPKCALLLVIIAAARATTVPSMSLEDLVDRSDLIVSGQVSRSWSAWDNEHKYIWTHYELNVASTFKGHAGSSIVISEPGGAVGTEGMSVAGAVGFSQDERVAVFLQRMPNGNLRTTGWGQGKFSIDSAGILRNGGALRSLEVMQTSGRLSSGTSIRTLDGMPVAALRARVSARTSVQKQGAE